MRILSHLSNPNIPVAAARGRLTGSLGYILSDLGRGTGPRGEKMVAACPGVDSQDLATIVEPFRAIFADLGPDLNIATVPELKFLRNQHCVDMSVVETGQMSAVETRQMSQCSSRRQAVWP